MNRFARSFAAIALLVGLASCAGTNPRIEPSAAIRTDPWIFDRTMGRVIQTPHFAVYTTFTDDEVLDNVTRVLEGAIDQYRLWAPIPKMSADPLAVYLFQYRDQWAQFTREHTGADAVVYLQITRGGYTVGDWSASYYLGEQSTYTVAAHEGWHQFVARHFKDRLPPFLEEGIACTFESVTVTPTRLHWHPAANTNRTLKLRSALEAGNVMPLNQLIGLHAGDVVDRGMDRIEAFYAQCWAFACFLRDADEGRYRPALNRLLLDAADGKLYDPTRTPLTPAGVWKPQSVPPMLEHYLGMPLEEIDQRFQAYMILLARE